jgi:hypothetical protein
MKTVAQDLYMQMIQAMDEYEVLGHSGQVLWSHQHPIQQDHLTANDNDEMTSDEESIVNR